MSTKKSCAIQKDKRFAKLRTKVLDVLVQARNIIRAESRWTEGEWGVDASGLTAVRSSAFGKKYADVCKVCAEGAVACASADITVYRKAVEALNYDVSQQDEKDGTRLGDIVGVNDEAGRSETVSFFTKTIRRLRAEQKRKKLS